MRSVLHALCGRGAPFLLLLTVVCAGQTNNRAIDLPNVTGPYLIGRESFHWTDNSRGEDGTEDKRDHRELMVHLVSS